MNNLIKFKFWIIGVGSVLAIIGITAYAAQVTIPSSTMKGDIPTGSTKGNYGLLHPGSDGLFLRASSTSVTGYDFATASTSGGTGLSNLNGLVASTQTFATGTATGIGLNIVSSGSTHTFTPTISAGYSVPLTASTTQWNNFYNSPTSFLTAGPNITLSGTSTVGVIASPSFTNGTFTGTLGVTGVSTLASTTISQLTLGNGIATGCLTNTSGLISSTGVACGSGSGSGGLGTTTPFTAGYIPEATGTNVTLSNSNIFQTAGGNIGIATVTPDNNLVVKGDVTGGVRIGSTGCGTVYAGIGFTPLSGCNNFALAGGDGSTYLGVPSGGNIYMRVAGTIEAQVTSAGNFSITNALSVTGTSTLATTTVSQLSLGDGLTNSYLAVNPSGLVIATTTPLLTIGSGTTNNCVKWAGTNLLGDAGAPCGSGGGSNQWIVGNGVIYNATSTDSVGIGIINPTSTLTVQGNGAVNPFLISSSTGSSLASIDQNGQLLNAASITIVHTNSSGFPVSNVYYATSTSEVDAGNALLTAINTLASGDTVYLSANTFNVGANQIDLAKNNSKGTELYGAGKYQTVIKSSLDLTATNKAIIHPAAYSVISNLSIVGYAGIGTYQLPIGIGSSDTAFGTSTFSNIFVDNWSDGIYIKKANTLLNVYNVDIKTGYDAVNVLTAGTLNIYNSTLYVVATSTALARGMEGGVSGVTINSFDNNVYVVGNSTNPSLKGYDNAFISGAVINIYGGVASTTNSSTKFDVITGSGGVINVAPDFIYTTHSGTPTVMQSNSINRAGLIGIGTTSPAYTLDVYGSGTTNPFNVSSSSNQSLFNIASNGSTTLSSLATAGLVRTTSAGSLYVDGASYQTLLTNPITGTGVNGQVTYFNGLNSVTSTSAFLDNGTVIGINATSAAASLDIKGTTGTYPLLLTDSYDSSNPLAISNYGEWLGNASVNIASTTDTFNFGPSIVTFGNAATTNTYYGVINKPTINLATATTTITTYFNTYSGVVNTKSTLTNYYGNYIDSPPVNANTTLTNVYGLVVAGTASSTKYTVFNGFGTTTPAATLTLQGSSGQTADLFDIASSTGSNVLSVNTNVSGTYNLLQVGTTTAGSLFVVDSLGNTFVNHLIGSSTLPTIATSTGDGAAAGTATITANGTDLGFQVTAVTGNAPAANATIWTATFSRAFTNPPICSLTSNTTTPAFIEDTYLQTQSTSTLLKSSTTALTGTSTYASSIICAGVNGG